MNFRGKMDESFHYQFNCFLIQFISACLDAGNGGFNFDVYVVPLTMQIREFHLYLH